MEVEDIKRDDSVRSPTVIELIHRPRDSAARLCRYAGLTLDGSGESNTLVGLVKDGVVCTNKDITQDPDGPGQVDTGKTADALGLASSSDLQMVETNESHSIASDSQFKFY